MKSIFCFTALFVASFSYGQDYIVMPKGDTVRGEVRILSYDLMDRVQLVQGKKKTTFTAIQVRNANLKGELYTPVKFENAIRMMKVIRSGFLSLYGYKMPNQMTFDGRLLTKPGVTPQEVPNLGFKKYVGAMVEDCPQVADRLKTGDLDRQNIEEIVDLYNACITQSREQRISAAEATKGNPTTDFVEQLKNRVSASDLTTKTEVNDLLNSINDKVRKKEPIPGYMKEGLKSYLSQREDFKEDMDKLLLMLQ